tara:strand:- start:307 stop:471 length:165 start_codon:yes stop_codon:yes gene_type:complete
VVLNNSIEQKNVIKYSRKKTTPIGISIEEEYYEVHCDDLEEGKDLIKEMKGWDD